MQWMRGDKIGSEWLSKGEGTRAKIGSTRAARGITVESRDDRG